MTKLPLRYVNEYRDGTVSSGAISGALGTSAFHCRGYRAPIEFMAAYQAAVAGVAAPLGINRTKPGTVNAAIVGYCQSPAFAELAAGTRAERRNILERFREQYGDNRIAMLEQRRLVKQLSRMRPAASRNWLARALRALLDFADCRGIPAGQSGRGHQVQKIQGQEPSRMDS